MILGLLLGIIAGAYVDNTASQHLIHKSGDAALLGLIAGLWVAWPICSLDLRGRRNLLHPKVRIYKLPVQKAFAEVRQVLSNATYNYGDSWYVSMADTQRSRIKASLKFTDEKLHMEGSSISRMQVRKERLQRLLELEVQMEGHPDDTTAIQFDFQSKVEGLAWDACDRVIHSFMAEVESLIGPPAEVVGEAKPALLPAPPWWLIAITVLCLLSCCGSVLGQVGESAQKSWDAPSALDQARAERDRREQRMRDEINAWNNFKERYSLR